MVWVGIGSLVPVAAIFVATFPVLFLNTAEGVSALDRRLFLMARLYHVPRRRVLRRIIVPGIYAYLLAGFSFALGICWKVTATAEFIGSSSGIGSEIYWSFRYLDMPRLFAWAVVLVTFGVVLERLIIRPMRRSVQRRRHGDD
jgi:NitT/TauT family transport system permease protein